ncbi:lysosomal acid glucosylceramidase-like [Nomia melanderi]|uniref:lysosomal acid glucosylceramidase-like n=1 Tax=Nomia melanderi TaxID=2448451 RepID=UPI0013041EAB|nr:lysosomal acid glucosylceramidase-like [Nomia melanderi]
MLRLLFLVVFVLVKSNANGCVPRSFGNDGIVCVCNATYCDNFLENVKSPGGGKVNWYVTNKEGQRLSLKTAQFDTEEKSSHNITIDIDSSIKYQRIIGFGGAMTDSSGMNIMNLSPGTQQKLLESYFGNSGAKFTVVRIPIGGTDFSTRIYSYDDYDDDASLEHFALAEEDYKYKIPLLLEAMKLEPDLKFIASTWSAPAWMKTVDSLTGNFGLLKMEYFQVYADYLVKFLDEYKAKGIKVAAITTGNEPSTAFSVKILLNKMGWTPDSLATWIVENLEPTLTKSDHNDTLILAPDDQTPLVQSFMEQMFSNEKARQYVAGIATHWYNDANLVDAVFTSLEEAFPDKFLLMTEASIGVYETEKVVMGSWKRAETYITSIIQYLSHRYAGWIEWNIALDTIGGPTWSRNFLDTSILVNADADEFYKQPMYYALAHVSRFVVRDSYRISMNIHSDDDPIQGLAFTTPSSETVVLLYNRDVVAHKVVLRDTEKHNLSIQLSPKSINTLIYKL